MGIDEVDATSGMAHERKEALVNVLKTILACGALAVALTGPLLTPAPAQAWWARGGYGWHGGYGWGWHGGWGWRGGVYVGGPAVVVGAPIVAAPPVVYAPRYRWFPGYYSPYHVWVGPHWGYR